MSLTGALTFLKGKEVVVVNAIIAILTIGGQQLFSLFTFCCPCQVMHNLYYGLAFLGVPALILLILGYALNDQTWRLVAGEKVSAARHSTRNHLLQCKLVSFVFCSITGRALVAPVTWLAVALLNGSYYICAMSEFASVDRYGIFKNTSFAERKQILAAFPCKQLVPSHLRTVKEEVILLLQYQSQVVGWLLIAVVAITVFVSCCLARCLSPLSLLHLQYWNRYIHNEQMLFEQAANQHSKIYAKHHIKKFFGFFPGSEDVSEIRIPSCADWKSISGLDLLTIVDEQHYDYSLLHDWAVEDSVDGKYLKILDKPNSDLETEF
ncbi:calcium homeostasis modulator protein 4 [Eublepharis macularius]|uniref:Calcium homeostasis modulator protein 4 n=1 Tax=Eublepharis macularius TaxID=481883 RepID=A0AA97IXV2_EUBMA|nr:calcium homeostasis modulator protein 4 [Eublepharis macularius]